MIFLQQPCVKNLLKLEFDEDRSVFFLRLHKVRLHHQTMLRHNVLKGFYKEAAEEPLASEKVAYKIANMTDLNL